MKNMHADAGIRTRDLSMSNEQADRQLKKIGEKVSKISCDIKCELSE